MTNKFLKTGVTAALFIVCGNAIAEKATLIPSVKKNDQTALPRIVNGEQATQENWPWMTAYVGVYSDFESSLNVASVNYETNTFSGGAAGQASGEIVNCGIGDAVCADATDKICLIERGEINFSTKADNCEAGGGVGAIIYNNEEEGNILGNMGSEYTGTIPVLAVTREDGLTLLNQVGNVANLSISNTSTLKQNSSCGASFLGDKWVLTAAHCVDDGNPNGYKMNVGEYDLSDGAENAIDIANIYIHPLYDADLINNDIALVELVSSVAAPAVQIASDATTEQYTIENSIATVAGWGGRVGYEPDNGSTSDFPDILHKVDLQLMTNQQCIDTLNKNPDVFFDDTYITSKMLCAFVPEGGKGSCQGDSGGPLVINTGSGVQQVGIVSFGRGCAAKNNPGVYTRISQFKDWMSAIKDGIAVTQRLDFGLGLEGQTLTDALTVTNNSTSSVNLSFALTGSEEFSLDASSCGTLEAGSSCKISIAYLPSSAKDVSAELVITTGNQQIPTSSSVITGLTLGTVADLAAAAGTNSDAVTLFSGGTNGASGWAVNAIEGIDSGVTDDSQDNILVAEVKGEGVLTFEWAVSSEENTDMNKDDPDYKPYDALYLSVNGELYEYISGEKAYTEYSINLAEGTNLITWTYSKDQKNKDGEDKGYIRNLVFTPPTSAEPTPAPAPAPTPGPTTTVSSGGGGSLGWVLVCLIGLVFRPRKHA